MMARCEMRRPRLLFPVALALLLLLVSSANGETVAERMKRDRETWEANKKAGIKNPNAGSGGDNAPPLVKAIKGGSVAEVEKLLQQTGGRAAAILDEVQKVPALCLAAQTGREDMVKAMLAWGSMKAFDIGQRDSRGASAVEYGVLGGSVAVVRLLVEAGLRVHQDAKLRKDHGISQDAVGSGWTLMDQAAFRRPPGLPAAAQQELAEYLLDQGVKVRKYFSDAASSLTPCSTERSA